MTTNAEHQRDAAPAQFADVVQEIRAGGGKDGPQQGTDAPPAEIEQPTGPGTGLFSAHPDTDASSQGQVAFKCSQCGEGYRVKPALGKCTCRDTDGFLCGGDVESCE